MAEIRYTARDFDALKQEMLAKIPVLAPAWTNLNEGDLGMALLNLLAGTADMLGYYIDRQANEAFLPTALTRESVMKLVRLIDYKLSRPVAAKTKLKFYLDSAATANITIPAYTQARTADGLYFTTREAVTLYAGQTFVEVEAYQGQFNTDGFTGSGQDIQAFALTKVNVAQNFLDVFVNAALWTEDSAALSLKVTSVYEVLTDVNENAVLRFSRFVGDVPSQNTTITANYLQTQGASGNIGSGLVTVLVTPITGGEALKVTNSTVSSGGKDRESLDEARANAPRQLRQMGRVVSLQDYVDALETFPKVAKAQAINHNGYVECYVAPDGGERFFVNAPAITTAAAASGTLAAGTYLIAVTALDGLGESSFWEYTPSTRALVDRKSSRTVTANQRINITITNVPGATAYNVYISNDGGVTWKLANANVAPAGGATTATAVITFPATANVALPAVNTTGVRAETGSESLREAVEEFIEDRRMLGTVFAVFNPTYVPVNVTATVKIFDNYSQTAVKGAVQSAIADFFSFDKQVFAEAVSLSALYATVMDVPGVRSVQFTLPADDVPLTDGQLAVQGTVTLTMTGGVA